MIGRVDVAALGLVLALALASMLSRCTASAQEPADDRFALVLVQVTAHEAGVDALEDVVGIHAALVHGAERHGMSPVAFAHAHAPRLFAGSTARAWVLSLRLNCSRPAGFPGRWTSPRAGGARSGAVSRRDACLALVARARELVAGSPLCAADDWAAPYVSLGAWLEAVDCGETRNRFARRVRR